MIAPPQHGENIQRWAARLVEELRPVLGLAVSGGLRLSRAAPNWLLRGTATAAERRPWAVYASPDADKLEGGAPNPAAWRTVRVHSGTINDVHPRTWNADSFSDDTDLSDPSDPSAVMDMELDAGKTSYLVAVQTRRTTAGGGQNAWDVEHTYLFFTSDDPATTPPFPGFSETLGAEVPDIFRNAFYRTVATVTCGSEANPEADDYHRLVIEQSLDADLAPAFTPPAFWEPVITIADPDDADPDEWRTAQVLVLGQATGFPLPDPPESSVLSVSATHLFFLKLTLDQDTGEATETELLSGAVLPEADEPEPGQAPEFVCRLLASLQVPAVVGKSVLTMAAANEEIGYEIVCVGFDCDVAGNVVNLLRGNFA